MEIHSNTIRKIDYEFTDFFEKNNMEIHFADYHFQRVTINNGYIVIIVESDENLEETIEMIKGHKKNNPKLPFILVSKHRRIQALNTIPQPFYFVSKQYMEIELQKALVDIQNTFKEPTIEIKDQGKRIHIGISLVYAVEIDDHYLTISTVNGEYTIRKTIGEFINQYDFVRINRSIAVNPIFIAGTKKKNILLTNGKSYKYSTKYYNKEEKL